MAAQGCVMTNKYAEGYPGKRYYGGCEFVDVAEELSKGEKLLVLSMLMFNHSGAQAENTAVYFAAQAGDTIGHEPVAWRTPYSWQSVNLSEFTSR